jgi:hypothetical protein
LYRMSYMNLRLFKPLCHHQSRPCAGMLNVGNEIVQSLIRLTSFPSRTTEQLHANRSI